MFGTVGRGYAAVMATAEVSPQTRALPVRRPVKGSTLLHLTKVTDPKPAFELDYPHLIGRMDHERPVHLTHRR